MNSSDEVAILRQTYTLCLTHRDALNDALQDLAQRELPALDLEDLSRLDRRLLDQFAYRHTRLQDDMGFRLFPSALRALGENIPAMSMLIALIEWNNWVGCLRRTNGLICAEFATNLRMNILNRQ